MFFKFPNTPCSVGSRMLQSHLFVLFFKCLAPVSFWCSKTGGLWRWSYQISHLTGEANESFRSWISSWSWRPRFAIGSGGSRGSSAAWGPIGARIPRLTVSTTHTFISCRDSSCLMLESFILQEVPQHSIMGSQGQQIQLFPFSL